MSASKEERLKAAASLRASAETRAQQVAQAVGPEELAEPEVRPAEAPTP